ncbi:type II secretion system F family protein [Methyloraptor flagellatus]|uniref:Type II secretion system F family protein n=1 Tax=Methyloraptor flagellatus TaxID=3162530 RepID=A0AAU7X8X5_9HYPH
MLGNPIVFLAVIALAMFCAGGLAYALLFDRVKREDLASKRMGAIAGTAKAAAKEADVAQSKRRNIQEALKELEARQLARAKQTNSPPLAVMIEQAGLDWTKKKFFLVSALSGVGAAAVVMFLSGNPLVAGGAGVIGFLGLPRWAISFMRKRRMKKFLDELPNAVDVIVRGIRSGLPLGDCLRIISVEAREPVRTEFRAIIETQALGIPLGDACMKLYERVPVQEANFFGIVIQIQQKAGGNLSEALGNLSKVLRERKKMKAKINAMSQEAKASASIIGSLPIIVGGLVYLTSPSYIMTLFTTNLGLLIICGSGFYMLIGILVMRKMINFDF